MSSHWWASPESPQRLVQGDAARQRQGSVSGAKAPGRFATWDPVALHRAWLWPPAQQVQPAAASSQLRRGPASSRRGPPREDVLYARGFAASQGRGGITAIPATSGDRQRAKVALGSVSLRTWPRNHVGTSGGGGCRAGALHLHPLGAAGLAQAPPHRPGSAHHSGPTPSPRLRPLRAPVRCEGLGSRLDLRQEQRLRNAGMSVRRWEPPRLFP